MDMRIDSMGARRGRPAITVPGGIDMPGVEKDRLPNGVDMFVLDCSPQEVVRVSFVFRAGSAYQPSPSAASAAANLLSEGTQGTTVHPIAAPFDIYGSDCDVSLGRVYAVIPLVALVLYFE